MAQKVLREHPCEEPKVYDSVQEAVNENNADYGKMWRAFNKGEAYEQWPFRFKKVGR